MKPSIEIDEKNNLIITHLKNDMHRGEIYEFMDDLHQTFKKLKNNPKTYKLLNNASEKSFQDLDSARELSDAFTQLLRDNHVQKFATLRPQSDYYSENVELYPNKFKIFDQEDSARDWLAN